ncbi:MAG TPA: ABC transporter substrate-binding protein [Methylomirabilota bacterium]|nr:ABC transporter substrate-binding protein [Methylomirabilota bacterium]
MPPTRATTDLARRAFLQRALLLGGGALAGPGLLTLPRPAAAKKRGGTLTVGMPNDFNTFDPQNLSFANFTLQQNLYDTLVRYDGSLKPLPGLAERWTIAPDGHAVTLSLRRGVRFHSGKELVAADVVKNFEKAADKERGQNMLPAVANVASVTAPDAGTVAITFKKVSPEITDVLQAMAIIEPAAMDSLKNRGSGTGPFKFVEWVPGDHTTLERNGAYWGAPAPYVDRVVFKVFSDSDAMVAALQSGICDLVVSLPPKDVARLGREFNLVRGYPGALTYEIRVNGTKPPFDKKEARQALLYAIDRAGVVENVLFGVSQPTVLPFSPKSAAYDATLQKYPFDLKKAKELFDRAGVAGGKAQCLALPQFPELPAIGQILKADLAKIGFDLELVVLDSTQYYKRVLGGDFQLATSFSGNTQKYPTRVALNSIYRTANNPVWGNNVPKAYVDAINEANGTIDPTRQRAAFAKLNAALLDEAWVVSIAYRQSVFGLAKHVDGFAFTVDDMAVLESVSLEK